MTTYEEQLLLDYLGCSPDAGEPARVRRAFIDGVDGPKTQAARQTFRERYGSEPTAENLTAAVGGAAIAADEAQSVPDRNTSAVQPDDPYKLRQYLQADGKYHIPKGLNIRLSKDFKLNELECRCSRCKETVLSPGLTDAIQRFRDAVNMPVYIATAGGSGYRCKAHNAEVGGAANSLHTLGLAADLHCPGLTPYAMKQAADRLGNWGELGMYSWGIHLGTERPDGAHTRWDSR